MPPGLHPSASLRGARFLIVSRGARAISNSPTKGSTVATSVHAPILPPSTAPYVGKLPSLSVLPLNNVVRTYLITTMSSSPVLLNACLAVLNRMLNSKSRLLDPAKNQYLGWLFKKTFYSQFCGGENKIEVQSTNQAVKSLGYQGLILEYCLEVLDQGAVETDGNDPATLKEIEAWRYGMKQTLEMANPHDYVALKWSGLGSYAMQLLQKDQPPTPAMQKAMKEICDTAYDKNVRLLPGAEWEKTNVGIDSWTLDLMRKYNRSEAKGAIMYNTYQAYLKSTPGKLARHLAIAQKEGFVPGIKLVRGAYLSSEPRQLIWDTKEQTDKAYNDIMESLMRRRYAGVFQPPSGNSGKSVPRTELLLATHNHESVRTAQAIRKEQQHAFTLTGGGLNDSPIPIAFAQLYGMADDLSCEIIQTLGQQERDADVWAGTPPGQPEAFKSVSWGTLTECLHFLHRRATENKDAAMRTNDTRVAMGAELWRRLTRPFKSV